ncbi:hypothetical protein [Arthrobacter sp. SLBN-122]|jgi:hypothetical protein|uniref:hypothetical protein n=1 Tax=Arthrobacter sp. SLBN-122 TaxID=2768455 RepID=UPI00115379BF|nr:hypothetical protein [Arthrobacter sp. SLBN-122]TQJ34710.1 hypothetical protein FBY36_1958 [Arthrobacter sp. SLBN-122]
MLIPITVHVPEHRVQEFQIRFGEFIAEVPEPDAPTRLPSGTVPAWVETGEAPTIAATLWDKISLRGQEVLLHMIQGTGDQTMHFLPRDIAKAVSDPKGAPGVAGTLGGVGKAVRRAGLPLYVTPKGKNWHYIWDWDGVRYSMTPEVAALLRGAADISLRSDG